MRAGGNKTRSKSRDASPTRERESKVESGLTNRRVLDLPPDEAREEGKSEDDHDDISRFLPSVERSSSIGESEREKKQREGSGHKDQTDGVHLSEEEPERLERSRFDGRFEFGRLEDLELLGLVLSPKQSTNDGKYADGDEDSEHEVSWRIQGKKRRKVKISDVRRTKKG